MATTEPVVGTIVLGAMDRPPLRTRLRGALDWIFSKWHVFTFILTLLGVLIGWGVYHISPLHSIEEIARKQEQERARTRMVGRHLRLGHQFLNVNQLGAARDEFSKALKLHDTNAEAQLGLLKTEIFEPLVDEEKRKDSNPEIIEKRLRLVLAEHPRDPHALMMLGSLHFNIRAFKDARGYYEAALRADKEVAAAYTGLGELATLEQRPEEALKMYEKAVALSPWNRHSLGNLAWQYEKLGDQAKDPRLAQSHFEQVVARSEALTRLDRGYLLGYFALGRAQLRLGQLEKARDALELLARLSGRNDIISLQRNQGTWVWPTAGQNVELYGNEPKAAYGAASLALCLQVLGDEAGAEAQLQPILSLPRKDRGAILHLLRHDADTLLRRQPTYKIALNRFKERLQRSP